MPRRSIRGHREWFYALIVLAAVTVAGGAFAILDQIASGETNAPQSSDRADRERERMGAIVMREGGSGQCRRLAFDNATGVMSAESVGACVESPAPGMNSTEGRMRAIRETFAGR